VQAGTPTLGPEESRETTHFTVVDAEGNVVTNTYTLNGSFGAGATATGLGFLLNNEMDDFTSKVGSPNAYGVIQGENNAIAPRKRPLSSMTPTIVLKDGKLLLAVGSPGGPTIINTVLQVLINVIDFGMNLQQAIDQPRVHHQWLPDQIQWEPWGISRDTRTVLEQRGHHFAEKPSYMGDAHGIMIDAAQGGLRLGACDPRFAGIPVGY
jgi:gamma-glutamyltranspeptidase/glutathione hydrolase